jgi:hypothetical protein
MLKAFRSYCTLLLLATSVTFAQNMPAQEPGATSGAPGMSSMRGDPATEASLQKMEMELSKAVASHDTTPFAKYIDDNIVALGPGWKSNSKAEVIDSIKNSPCTTVNTTVSGFSYKWLSPDIVLVSFMENGTMTCNGKTTQVAEHDSSLWQRKNGKWMAVFHQETADMPNPSDTPSNKTGGL